jgi:hypothetical protein
VYGTTWLRAQAIQQSGAGDRQELREKAVRPGMSAFVVKLKLHCSPARSAGAQGGRVFSLCSQSPDHADPLIAAEKQETLP